MFIEIKPRKIFKTHINLILILLCANFLVRAYVLLRGNGRFYWLIPLFDFNSEQNIPTFFSSIMIITCSILLYLIAVNNKKSKSSFIPWFGLSLIFLFISIDEISSIHERLTVPMRGAFGASGLLYYSWVIPYSIALFSLIIAYAKFLFKLPKNILFLFVLSGFTFISGAIGFEMIGGIQDENFGKNSLLYFIFYTCEELLEMFGIAIFLYTLLTYITNQFGPLRIIAARNQ